MLLTSCAGRFGFRWQKAKFGKVDDFCRIAVRATVGSFERGSDLRMLWKMLVHHEESIEEMEDTLKSGYDDDVSLGTAAGKRGYERRSQRGNETQQWR